MCRFHLPQSSFWRHVSYDSSLSQTSIPQSLYLMAMYLVLIPVWHEHSRNFPIGKTSAIAWFSMSRGGVGSTVRCNLALGLRIHLISKPGTMGQTCYRWGRCATKLVPYRKPRLNFRPFRTRSPCLDWCSITTIWTSTTIAYVSM